jgi:hypothetical protein
VISVEVCVVGRWEGRKFNEEHEGTPHVLSRSLFSTKGILKSLELLRANFFKAAETALIQKSIETCMAHE